MKRSLMNKALGIAVASALVWVLGPVQSALADPIALYWTDRDNATLTKEDLVAAATSTQMVTTGFTRLQDVDLARRPANSTSPTGGLGGWVPSTA